MSVVDLIGDCDSYLFIAEGLVLFSSVISCITLAADMGVSVSVCVTVGAVSGLSSLFVLALFPQLELQPFLTHR